MATTITMPQLGETVTEGTVSQWLKRPGDSVEKYEPFVEVSTDKVNAEVPAPVSGIIRELLAKEGQTVPTGAAIAIIDEVGAAAETVSAPTPATPAHAAPEPETQIITRTYEPEPGRRFSPAVRRLAREHAVDLTHLQGTGTSGRVTADDVLAAAHHAAPPTSNGVNGASSYAAPIPGHTIPLNHARRLIAERLSESKRTIPHAWTMVEVDVSNAWAWRAREREAFEREHGVRLTLLPFFIRAAVEALIQHPLMNARFTPQGIYVNPEINISIAVGLEGNLILPVIRNADKLSIKGLALATSELIDKARRGKLNADALSGGTFTVNNTGVYGSVLSAPIIPLGQTSIVTMEAVVKRPVVRDDDAIAIRSMMNVCLSLDHRVVDGTIACAFLADLKRHLEAMGPTGVL